MRHSHTRTDLRRFQGGGEARMVFAVDIQDSERVVYFPEETPVPERQDFRDYTASSLRCVVPDCRASLVANFRATKRDGFSHRDGTGRHAPISLWHEQGQHLIEQWGAGRYPALQVEIERASSDRTRRPDITVTGKTGAVAIEVQYASIGVNAWRQRRADLAGQYLAQTWLLGHHGEHFKLATDGSLKFSALTRAMTVAGCVPLWLNPETAEVLTAWSEPDEHGPTPPRTAVAHAHEVVPLAECVLTPHGLRTPALEKIDEAAARRVEAARRRASTALRARRQRQQRWENSKARSWVIDRHDGTLPGFIADPLRGDSLLAQKVDLTPEHWKAIVYQQIVADGATGWVTYKAILGGLARGKHRGLENPQFDTLNTYLRRLQGAGQIALVTSGLRQIRGARAATSLTASGNVETVDCPTQEPANITDHSLPTPSEPKRGRQDETSYNDRATQEPDRSAMVRAAVPVEAIEARRRRRRWRLRIPWLRRQ